MATILEASGLGSIISMIMVFLLVFVVVFALLKKSKFFGGDGFDAIIAFVFAVFTIMVPETQVVVGNFLPWFFMFLLLALVIFMFFMFMGVKGETIAGLAKEPFMQVVGIGAIVVLFFISMTQAFGPFLLVDPNAVGFWATTKRFLFTREFLGVVVLFFIGAYSITFLSRND
ncbi:hypothetical protein HOF78_00315 [Candidatus Woesearchaeota archaeon]|jgi:hypothetical protein|nr:hypothetical protein [Candidatus Woesearchaeota archaeon]MBT6044590.1 hypothetical protein [Candidatus Woesearchaeota archaeon]